MYRILCNNHIVLRYFKINARLIDDLKYDVQRDQKLEMTWDFDRK